jgi:hypothetical protein
MVHGENLGRDLTRPNRAAYDGPLVSTALKQNRRTNMKPTLLATVAAALITQTLLAQQFTPPALPPGVKGTGERAESEILKVYAMEDQGSTFRAYVVKYKGNEVVVSDPLATTSKKVGDKITILATRVEAPLGARTVRTLSFQILNTALPKKP